MEIRRKPEDKMGKKQIHCTESLHDQKCKHIITVREGRVNSRQVWHGKDEGSMQQCHRYHTQCAMCRSTVIFCSSRAKCQQQERGNQTDYILNE